MDDRLVVPVFYDFASTIAFVAHRVMQRMRPELVALGVELDWRPVDLVRITGWARGAVVDGPRRENALRVARDLGVDVRMPAFWIDSRDAHAIALRLAGEPREPAWRERVWTAVFEEGRDVGRREDLERLAADLAIDVDRALDDAARARLEADTEAACGAGVNGVPTFVLDGFPFGGIQEADAMRSLIGRWAAKRRRRGD